MSTTRTSRSEDWLSYESVAEVYNQLLVPIFFARPSKDLVDALHLTQGDRVLDVGTGPGVTAALAAHAVGVEGIVVGIDPAESMLHIAQRRGVSRVVVGGLPSLPFSDAVFGTVMASFVLPNISDYRTGLRDMIRVLRPGGTIGVTTWGVAENQYSLLWREVSGRFASSISLQDAKNEALPWQEHFNSRADLERPLQEAGLEVVAVSERVYHMKMRQDEYLLAKQVLGDGRLLRHLMGETAWAEFYQSVTEEFAHQFGETIEYDRSAFFGIAKKRFIANEAWHAI